MTKQMFLDILKTGLSDLPTGILGDILYEYKDYFDTEIASGKTEDEISEELGSPYEIINKYRDGYLKKYTPNENNSSNYNSSDFIDANYSNVNEEKENINHNYTENNNKTNTINDTEPSKTNTTNIILTLIILVLGLIFLGPMILGLGAGTLGLIVGMLGATFALSIAGIGILVGKVVTNTVGIFVFPAFILDFPNSVIVLMVIGSVLSFIFFFLVGYYLIKWIIRLLARFIDWLSLKIKGEK